MVERVETLGPGRHKEKIDEFRMWKRGGEGRGGREGALGRRGGALIGSQHPTDPTKTNT